MATVRVTAKILTEEIINRFEIEQSNDHSSIFESYSDDEKVYPWMLLAYKEGVHDMAIRLIDWLTEE